MAKNNIQSISYLLCMQIIKTTNHPQTTKSGMTQTYIKQNIHKHQTQNFQRISPFRITPVEKAHMARTRWYRGPFRRF